MLRIIPKALLVALVVVSIFSKSRLYEIQTVFYAGQFFIVVILGAFLFSIIILQRQTLWIKSSIRVISLAFVIWVFFMIISLFNVPYLVSGTLLITSYVFLFLLAFILMPNYLNKESNYITYNKLFWWSVMGSLMLSVALGIKDPDSFYTIYDRFRYKAFFYNPGYLGAFSILGVLSSVQMYIITNQKKYIIAIIPLLYLIYLSNSRASIIAVLVALLVMAYLAFRGRYKNKTRILLDTATTIFTVLMILYVWGRMSVHFPNLESLDKFTSFKIFVWSRAIRLLENYEWLLGQGLGSKGGGSLSFDNYYINVLIQTGLLGLLSFITFLVLIIFFLGRKLNRKPHDKELQACFAGLIAIMIYSLAGSTLFSLGNILSIYVWINVGYQMTKNTGSMNTLYGVAVLKEQINEKAIQP